jgi:hypothetical protein
MDSLQAGILAAREGRRTEARALLKEALQAEPLSEQGWLWMSAVVDSRAERRVCLERVLSINPHNQTALSSLDQLSPGSGSVDSNGSHSPVSPPSAQVARERSKRLVATDRASRTASPHSMPTLGIQPASSTARPIRHLSPLPDPPDELAQLRASQFQTLPEAAGVPTGGSDPFMALILIGGLSITAIAGGMMLVILLIIGWPP